VRVPSNDLMRVRVGGFAAQAEATSLRDRVRSAGLEAVVVDDATSETAVP
jgi:cell division protein FtsN